MTSPHTIYSYTNELTRDRDRYRQLGEQEAANFRPPSDASSLDKNEVQLRTDADKYLAHQRELFNEALQQASTALSGLEQRLIQWKIKKDTLLSEPDFSLSIADTLGNSRPKLVPLTEKRMRAEVAIRAFRARNNIPADEQARYPESIIWHFGIIIALLFAETVMNAFFYRNDQGLLGGFIIALLVAIVNLGIPIGLGWASRYRNLPQPDKRALGWLAVGLFVFWLLFANALFAAFRAEYQTVGRAGGEGGMATAFRSAFDNALGVFTLNLNLADFQSFILFGMGMLFCSLAFWKGLTSDDKYPGHSVLDKEVKEARANEQRALEGISEQTRGLLRTKIAETQTLLSEPPQLIAAAVARAGALDQEAALLAARRQAVQRDFELVLSTYRQANLAIRVTAPPPYFEQTPTLPPADPGPVYEHTRDGFNRLRSDANAARSEAESGVQTRVTALMTLSSQLSDRLQAFTREVVEEATDQIESEKHSIGRLLK